MKSPRIAVLLIAACMLLLGGWRTPVPEAKHKLLPTGDWGGDHVSMKVTASGAELEFDCASARIPAPIALDSHRRFDVPGDYHAQHAGPIRREEGSQSANARFTGKLSGSHLALTITLSEDNRSVGDFALEKGSTGHVFKCR